MIGAVRVPHPIMVLHGGGSALACALNGQIHVDEQHGFFAGDTRMLSTYQITIGGHQWHMLGRSRYGSATAQWEFQNPAMRDPVGNIPAGRLLLSLRRRVDGALHDDLCVRSYHDRPVKARLTLQLDADFADIFQVKCKSLPPRLMIRRDPHMCEGMLAYEAPGFRRAILLRCRPCGEAPSYAGSRIVFDLDLTHGAEWTCCLDATPEIDGKRLQLSGDPHGPEPGPAGQFQRVAIRAGVILERPFERGREDFYSLTVGSPDHSPYVAAGVPWFLTLFGRDTLISALMAGLDGVWSRLTVLWRLLAHCRPPNETIGEMPNRVNFHMRCGGANCRSAMRCLTQRTMARTMCRLSTA
jgi:hypothetical protein